MDLCTLTGKYTSFVDVKFDIHFENSLDLYYHTTSLTPPKLI